MGLEIEEDINNLVTSITCCGAALYSLSSIYHLFSLHYFRRPIKAAIAASSEHLAGLLPLHLGYSHAHETATEVCSCLF